MLNELGVVRFREGALQDAMQWLTRAKTRCAEIGEPLVPNEPNLYVTIPFILVFFMCSLHITLTLKVCSKMWEAVLFNLGRVCQKMG